MDRKTIQNTNKKIDYLNNFIDQLDLIDIQRKIYPTTENTHIPQAYGTFYKVDHTLDQKTSLNDKDSI